MCMMQCEAAESVDELDESRCRGHEAAVLCIQFDCEKIISGSCDKTIKVVYVLLFHQFCYFKNTFWSCTYKLSLVMCN